jgi:hypothetical protein
LGTEHAVPWTPMYCEGNQQRSVYAVVQVVVTVWASHCGTCVVSVNR